MARECSPLLKSIANTRKNTWTVSIPSVTPSMMASLKPEEVIQEVLPSSSFVLCLAGKGAYQKLLAVVNSLCKIFDVPFQDFLNVVKPPG